MSARDQSTDFLERLDAAIGCMQCTRSLEDSVSDLFCSEECAGRYAAARTGWHEDYINDDEEWGVDALADLEPVSWISPPVWRLPRSTGDLDADRRTLDRALELAQTDAQRAACAVRLESLNERQRAVWAREWRFPRSTGNYRADQNAVHEAHATATTDDQRAACTLRQEDLNERRRTMSPPRFPGRAAHWGIDNFVFSPLRDFPIVPREEAQRAADAILASRPADSEFNAVSVLGDAFSNNLPGIARGSLTLRGHSRTPDLLTYEMRRDSDNNLMAMHRVPEDHRFSFDLPYYLDITGCSWRVINSRGEEIRRFPVTSRSLYATSDPAPRPALGRGHTVSITTSNGTRSYTVEGVAPDGSLTCRRITEGEQVPVPTVHELTADEYAEYRDAPSVGEET